MKTDWGLTICLAISRKARKERPMTTVCQAHCSNNKIDKYWLTKIPQSWQSILIHSITNLLLLTSVLFSKTDCITGMNPIFVVKWTIPSSPFSCWSDTMIAAPPMNPVSVGFDRKSTMKPNLQEPTTACEIMLEEVLWWSQWVCGLSISRCKVEICLRRPKLAWKTPAKKVAVKASWRYRVGSLSGETTSLNMDPMTNDAIDTGPTARSLELPRTE